MTDLMSVIKGRRSIRRYQEKEIPEESLRQVLEAVRWSPSWANTQCWEVIVVRDAGMKSKLQETLSATNPAGKAFAQAPVILALCGKLKSSGFYKNRPMTKLGDWFMFDLGIATQSLCLAAHDLGLGTVIVGSLNHDHAKEILGVDESHELVALIPLGYPAKDSPAPRRREINEFLHEEKF